MELETVAIALFVFPMVPIVCQPPFLCEYGYMPCIFFLRARHLIFPNKF
jgi:hypothetical protein